MIFAVIFAGIFGAVWGSFSVAQVWRIRARQLFEMKKQGEEFSKAESKEFSKISQLVNERVSKDRSRCLTCGYTLRARDLVPIFSWLSLRGKCRNCRTPIGWLELAAEVFSAAVFAILAFVLLSKNLPAPQILAFFATILPLPILLIYDAKWGLLPSKVLWVFLALAGGFFALSNFVPIFGGEFSRFFEIKIWTNLLFAAASFPLIYWALAVFSKERAVGGGDWILALALILILPSAPIIGVVAMFFSNIFALIFACALVISKKVSLKKGAQIPFGPAMIAAAVFILIFWRIFESIFQFLV